MKTKLDPRRRITPEAIAAYREAMATEATYVDCIRGKFCLSRAIHVHCATCAAHLEATRRLDRALGLRPWQGLDTDTALARELRRALEARRR
jgi:hypothetical protein